MIMIVGAVFCHSNEKYIAAGSPPSILNVGKQQCDIWVGNKIIKQCWKELACHSNSLLTIKK